MDGEASGASWLMAGSRPTPGDEWLGSEGLAEASAPFGTAAAAPLKALPPIVAIGASAGGLEAIEQFFAAIEAPSRFAFAVVQALSPDFQSLMVELLAKRTALAVRVVEDGMAPAADAIHLIPPGRTMTIEGGRFCLADRDPRDLVHHPIDEFFVSLATDRGSSAIGVLLSGSGSDGSRGARAIQAAGGRVLVQEPKTATFSTMPQHAIEAGCNEEVMAPDALARALLAAGPRPPRDLDPEPTTTLPPALAACLDQAFGIDFGAYRNSTVQHRVHRRMMLRGFDRLDAYTSFVADDPDEQEALFQDLLIGPTGFCRDPAATAALEREVVPSLAARLDAGDEVRIWVPACATGEEAYALAMLILAQCRKSPGAQEPPESLPLRIFATDVHRRSLGIAGAGFYSEEATADLHPEWRERFFGKRGSGWQVDQAVRRTITFSRHDLLRDPPVARVQLISCRNLLGYLEPAARDRVLAGFADALLPGGHLLLGSDETAARHDASFAALDLDLPLYRKKRGAAASERGSLVGAALPPPGPPLTVGPGRQPSRERRDQRLTMAHERLLDRYVPPSLLVDEAGQVIHCFGDAGPYLETPRGRPSLAVLDMVKEPLRAPLASAINRVERTGRPITLARLALARGPDAPLLPRLVVDVPCGRQDGQRCLLVSFDDRPVANDGPQAADPQAGLDHATLARLDELERDLRFGEENLKDTIANLEAANTALDARNQELVTAVEAARTSLDALETTGLEHQHRIDSLRRRGDELESLIEAADLAALLLAPDLSVRRFTPAATRWVNLLPEDTGRPLAHVTHHFRDTDIVTLLSTAATDGTPAGHDTQTTDGTPVRLAVTPLLAPDRSIKAIVLCIHERALPEAAPTA